MVGERERTKMSLYCVKRERERERERERMSIFGK